MIKLCYNNSYKWFCSDNCYSIGYAFYKGDLYENEKFNDLVNKLDIPKQINELNGFFSIVKKEKQKITLVSDVIRAFPVFYTKNGDVFDKIDSFNNSIKLISKEELLKCGWVSGYETIYDNIFQLEASQIVTIENKKITRKTYFEYKLNEGKNGLSEINNVLDNVFSRLIKYLNGRTAVIPLSGGQDSRLIAYYLKKLNYNNVITFTYGNKKGGEVNVSKKVAEFLDIPWYFVEYTQKNCKELYGRRKEKIKIFDYYGRGTSVPIVQDLTAIYMLKRKKIIDKNCVIIPGYSLDFLAGTHTYDYFVENKKVETKKIVEYIYHHNYNFNKKDNTIFNFKIEKLLGIKFDNTKISSIEAQTYYEKFDFVERQAKFINNAIRNYDYLGFKWYLPFWDKELILYWNNVSLKNRYKRKLFNDFTLKEYPKLMEYAPIYIKRKNSFNGKFKILKKFKSLFSIYHSHDLNLYYFFKFTTYLKNVLFYRNFNVDYYLASEYINYLLKQKKGNNNL